MTMFNFHKATNSLATSTFLSILLDYDKYYYTTYTVLFYLFNIEQKFARQ